MRLGQDLREIAIAFVGDDDRRSGLGDEKVRARYADVGGQELGPQHLARLGQQLFGFGKTALRQEIADAPCEIPARCPSP